MFERFDRDNLDRKIIKDAYVEKIKREEETKRFLEMLNGERKPEGICYGDVDAFRKAKREF